MQHSLANRNFANLVPTLLTKNSFSVIINALCECLSYKITVLYAYKQIRKDYSTLKSLSNRQVIVIKGL